MAPVVARPLVYAEPVDDRESTLQPGMALTQVIAILRAYWKQSLAIFIAVTLLSAIGLKFLPKTYTAMATMIVDTNQKDPLAGQEFPLALLNNYIITQSELMQGPAVLLPVIDKLGLTQDKEFAAGFSGDARGLRDYVANSLSKAIQVDQGRGGNLLYLSVSAHDPAKAATIANTITDVYLEQERERVNVPAGQRAQRYSEQIAELRSKVALAQQKVDAFRQQRGVIEVGPQADNNPDTETQALDSLEARLLDAQNQRRALEAKQAGNAATADEALASPLVQQLQTQLHLLEEQKVQLSATYGPEHPKLLAIKSQIAVVQRSLDSETGKLGANNATQLARAKALEDKYQRAVEDQRKKVLQLRDVQGEGGKLMLELASAQAVYKRALDGYDQIMFASVGDYRNVQIVSRATPPTKSSKPKKLKLLIVAAIGALGLALLLPLLYELLMNRRLRCRDDMERSFGVPVLMEFNPILGSPEHA
jgi:uncharacterized protein involved in exopolysaccharide biosynthesis